MKGPLNVPPNGMASNGGWWEMDRAGFSGQFHTNPKVTDLIFQKPIFFFCLLEANASSSGEDFAQTFQNNFPLG